MNILIIILIVLLMGVLCLFLGLFMASVGKLNQKEEKYTNNYLSKYFEEDRYEVTVRFLQKDGFTKTIIVKSEDEYGALQNVLSENFVYFGNKYPIYSVVSVHKINQEE